MRWTIGGAHPWRGARPCSGSAVDVFRSLVEELGSGADELVVDIGGLGIEHGEAAAVLERDADSEVSFDAWRRLLLGGVVVLVHRRRVVVPGCRRIAFHLSRVSRLLR